MAGSTTPSELDVHVDGMDVMPPKRCTVNGKSGWKWGDNGKCYPGEGGKAKAIAQGKAIQVNKMAFFNKLLGGGNGDEHEHVEKRMIERYDVSGLLFAYSEANKTLISLGLESETSEMFEVLTHDMVDKFALIVERGYANYKYETVKDGADNVQTVKSHALDLLEKKTNKISSVFIIRGLAKGLGGRPVFITIDRFVLVQRSESSEKADGVMSNVEFDKRERQFKDELVNKGNGDNKDTEVKTSKKAISLEYILKGADLDKGLVYGVVYEPYKKDAHDDWTTPEEIAKMAHDFLPRAMMNPHHKSKESYKDSEVVTVECYIAPWDFRYTPDSDLIIKDSWVVVSKIFSEEIKEQVRSGEFTGYSLEGSAMKVESP